MLSRSAASETAFLHDFADHLPELAWSATADGAIDFFNRRCYEYAGADFHAMAGWSWKDWIHPASVDEVLGRWRQAIAAGHRFEMEFPIRAADGNFHWFLSRVAPVHDECGELLRWFGMCMRIDEQRAGRERARFLADVLVAEQAAREEAERHNRAKDDFLAMVSHELRTPVSVILGWTKLLRAGELPGEKREKALATIERTALQQAELIEDLLDLSRAISGTLRLEVRPVHVATVLEAALESAGPALDAKQLRLETELESAACEVKADPARLQQVIWNLLANATKFTPRHGTIRVSLAVSDDWVELAVADSGIGIPAAFLPRVFDRFEQADGSAARTHGGLGLGLSIAKSIVEMHGGSITAESDGEGRGSTFRVRLPAR